MYFENLYAVVQLRTTEDFWDFVDWKVVREVDALKTAVDHSHWAHLADGDWGVKPQFSEIVGVWKSLELLCMWPLFQHPHDAMLNSSIPAFLVDRFAHQYLLLLVEQHYLLILARCYFMKKVELLFRVLCFFVHLLLDELQWPYFAPLSVLLLRHWIAKRQLFDPFFRD